MADAAAILTALGGKDNITEMEPCITRIRVEVNDPTKVNEDALSEAGAFGVVQVGNSVQVVVGPVADDLAKEMGVSESH